MRLDYEDYLDWLSDQPLDYVLARLELWTEHTPLALWLKHKLGLKEVHLCPDRFLIDLEWINLPRWAQFNEELSQEELIYNESYTVRQALLILDHAVRAVIEEQAKMEREEVQSGV